MDFSFFESLSRPEAESFLQNFLNAERDGVKKLITAAEAQGFRCDFSFESISPVLRWVVRGLKTTPRPSDEGVPAWIRETGSYQRGLFDFTEESAVAVMRSAFYLGESLVRSLPNLSWGVGNSKIAEQNMPVVKGFRKGIEMAPILVTDNLFRRILADGAKEDVIDRAVSRWAQSV